MLATFPCRLTVVFPQDPFEFLAHLFIAAVVNSIGIKEDNISRTH